MDIVNIDHQLWTRVLDQLQLEMPRASFDTWVRDTHVVEISEDRVVVGVKNAYARDWLDGRLSSTIRRILTGLTSHPMDVEFVVSSNGHHANDGQDAGEAMAPAGAAPAEVVQRPPHPALNPGYVFDTFVVGASNRLAHAACMAVAESPARTYNPLFLYGGVGLGKTHLLQAIGNACHQRGLSVLYVSSEEFTNDLVNAIRTHTTPAFRDKYRNIDVLLVDDIQFIAGKESTQEEFFHTFNTLHGQQKQIVLTSDRPPKALVTLEERLRSRFEWGLTADIQPPDYETRLAILRYKAERSRLMVPADVLEFIASRVQSNIRELEGALNRVVAFAQLSGETLNVKLTETALADLLPQQKDVDPERIIEIVTAMFNISRERLMSDERSRPVALPRQIVMYLLRKEANLSLPQIGEMLGGRDHTTVLYAIRKISDRLERDDRLRRQIVQIRQELYGPAALV